MTVIYILNVVLANARQRKAKYSRLGDEDELICGVVCNSETLYFDITKPGRESLLEMT